MRRRARRGVWRPRSPAAADAGRGWIDLEVARRRAVAADRSLAHDAVLYRQPVTTLDDHLARGLRVEALAELVEGFAPRGAADDDDALLERGRPRVRAAGPAAAVAPRLLRVRGPRRGRCGERRDGEVPEAWYRLPIFYFSNVSEIRGPDEPVWSPAASRELDYELEVAALVDTPARRPARGAGRGGDRRLHDPQRLVGARSPARRDDVRLGPAKGKDFATLDRAVARDAGRARRCATRRRDRARTSR